MRKMSFSGVDTNDSAAVEAFLDSIFGSNTEQNIDQTELVILSACLDAGLAPTETFYQALVQLAAKTRYTGDYPLFVPDMPKVVAFVHESLTADDLAKVRANGGPVFDQDVDADVISDRS